MSVALFKHFRALREGFRQIGAAVKASGEFSHAAARQGEAASRSRSGIPL